MVSFFNPALGLIASITCIRSQSLADKTTRIAGFDFARGLAVLAMVLVNFEVVMRAKENGAVWLQWIVSLFEGRAAATFVVLAGVGISLMTHKKPELSDQITLRISRNRLLKRAVFLFVIGLAYTPLWPADILHYYGVYIAIGSLLLTCPGRWLWTFAAASAALFVVLLFTLDYEAGWNWNTLTYAKFWTPIGITRNTLFNGFHPVIPWVSFLIAGMWLGRLDLSSRAVRKSIQTWCIPIVVIAEITSRAMAWLLLADPNLDTETADSIISLIGTAPMPPMPQYLLSAGATAFIVIAISISWTEKSPDSLAARLIISTGQLALTMYVAHVVVGMGILESIGLLSNQTLEFAVISALIFCAVGMLYSYLWTRRFKRGPLEWMMRRICG